MSDPVKPPRPSIWRESFSAGKRAIEYLWPWVAGYTILHTLTFHHQVGATMGLMRAKDAGIDPSDLPRPSNYVAALDILMQITFDYCFMLIYLQREPIARQPRADSNTFFYWLGQSALKYFILLAVVLVAAILAAGMVVAPEKLKVVLFLMTVTIAAGGGCYLLTRYLLVGPLAISLVKPALENSWILTQGNFWRLFWQNMVFVFIICLVTLFGVLVMILLATALHANFSGDGAAWGISAAVSIFLSLFMLVNVMFFCAACRILYNEELVRDPEFPGEKAA